MAPPTDGSRYRLLVEAVTDYAIIMLDPAGAVMSWNPGARRLQDYEPPEIIGAHFSRFYTPEDRDLGLPQAALNAAARDGKFDGEGWRVRKDGTRFWAHVAINPIRESGGALAGFAHITRDLTEQRRAEELLRRSEEQFRLLVQSVTDYAIYMLDASGNITSWNQGAQRIKGYLPDEIIGQHFSRFYTQEDRQWGEPERALETAVREGRFEREALRVRKDGSVFNAHVIIDPIRDAKGEVVGFAKVTRDITERMKAQRDLEQAREALFQSQKMDAIGQLTGGVAHDFNNLLMAVLSSLELAKKRLPDDPQVARLLDNAIQGAQRGSVLTQRMLSFARRQSLEPKSIDLQALMSNLIELLQRSIGSGARIETDLPRALPPVLADENQLELALLNLTVNARDASAEGGAIRIEARDQALRAGDPIGLPPGRYVRISVTDQGEGMDAQTLARATEPFFTTKGVGKGTGLGLSMVHGMAEQIGGRFALTSSPGQGTTAEIWLPAAAASASGQVAQSEQAEGGPAPSLKILAVDDDGLVLFNTLAMLEDLGHTALEAHSGPEALDILEKNPVDLVITDQAMPQMSGMQLIAAIKERWPGLPVILATGYAELPAGTAQEMPKLAKPFSEADLASTITRLFA
ncbi:MAG: PAS domain S-box protein [Alphaproteobacteria bacterium]|nr:PAS domain S-box protein [Alphaproteobacteria bacterium]